MFGRHNAVKSNREIAGEAVGENEHNSWQETMSDMPTFDEYIAEKSAESEKNPLDLESLKDVAGFSEQLEKMGANQEIIDNPAFKRVLG